MIAYRLVILACGLRHREGGERRALRKTSSLAGSLTSSRGRSRFAPTRVLADTRVPNGYERRVAGKPADIVACTRRSRVRRVGARLRRGRGRNLQRIHSS